MKKVLFGLAFLGAMAFSGSILFAQGMADPGQGGGFECKIELLKCNWYSSETRQICHQNGDGLSCICGQSTNCP